MSLDPSPPCPCRGKGAMPHPVFWLHKGLSSQPCLSPAPRSSVVGCPSPLSSPSLQPPRYQCPHLPSTHPSKKTPGLSSPQPHVGCWRPSSHRAQELLTFPHRHPVTLPHPPRSPPTGPQALRPGTGIQKEAMVPHLNTCSDLLSAPQETGLEVSVGAPGSKVLEATSRVSSW